MRRSFLFLRDEVSDLKRLNVYLNINEGAPIVFMTDSRRNASEIGIGTYDRAPFRQYRRPPLRLWVNGGKQPEKYKRTLGFTFAVSDGTRNNYVLLRRKAMIIS